MKEIGAVFRQIRESRHISLEEATGGEFSRSMLSRFERGENDLTTQRFFQALQQWIGPLLVTKKNWIYSEFI